MKQIYNFELNNPPILNETILRTELDKRRLQQQTTLLAISSLLLVVCMLLMALSLYNFIPALSVVCALYVCVTVTGSCVITLVFAQKRRSFVK